MVCVIRWSMYAWIGPFSRVLEGALRNHLGQWIARNVASVTKWRANAPRSWQTAAHAHVAISGQTLVERGRQKSRSNEAIIYTTTCEYGRRQLVTLRTSISFASYWTRWWRHLSDSSPPVAIVSVSWTSSRYYHFISVRDRLWNRTALSYMSDNWSDRSHSTISYY